MISTTDHDVSEILLSVFYFIVLKYETTFQNYRKIMYIKLQILHFSSFKIVTCGQTNIETDGQTKQRLLVPRIYINTNTTNHLRYNCIL